MHGGARCQILDIIKLILLLLNCCKHLGLLGLDHNLGRSRPGMDGFEENCDRLLDVWPHPNGILVLRVGPLLVAVPVPASQHVILLPDMLEVDDSTVGRRHAQPRRPPRGRLHSGAVSPREGEQILGVLQPAPLVKLPSIEGAIGCFASTGRCNRTPLPRAQEADEVAQRMPARADLLEQDLCVADCDLRARINILVPQYVREFREGFLDGLLVDAMPLLEVHEHLLEGDPPLALRRHHGRGVQSAAGLRAGRRPQHRRRRRLPRAAARRARLRQRRRPWPEE
mmetsp:Transcript_153610/g.492362  ORF Transcript_153610/g.492362 Transcript_153610/m.492362 type:complete len:283 (+) Transcript_153610:686-1534(+)